MSSLGKASKAGFRTAIRNLESDNITVTSLSATVTNFQESPTVDPDGAFNDDDEKDGVFASGYMISAGNIEYAGGAQTLDLTWSDPSTGLIGRLENFGTNFKLFFRANIATSVNAVYDFTVNLLDGEGDIFNDADHIYALSIDNGAPVATVGQTGWIVAQIPNQATDYAIDGIIDFNLNTTDFGEASFHSTYYIKDPANPGNELRFAASKGFLTGFPDDALGVGAIRFSFPDAYQANTFNFRWKLIAQ